MGLVGGRARGGPLRLQQLAGDLVVMRLAAGQDEVERTAFAFDESILVERPFRSDASNTSLATIPCNSARMPSDADTLKSLAAVTAFN
jgi:hypothetical protein